MTPGFGQGQEPSWRTWSRAESSRAAGAEHSREELQRWLGVASGMERSRGTFYSPPHTLIFLPLSYTQMNVAKGVVYLLSCLWFVRRFKQFRFVDN